MMKSPRIISPRVTSNSFKQDKLASPVLSSRRDTRAISPYKKEEIKETKKPEEITKELKRVAYSKSKLRQPMSLRRQETLEPNKTEEEKKEELKNIMNQAWKTAEEEKKKKTKTGKKKDAPLAI